MTSAMVLFINVQFPCIVKLYLGFVTPIGVAIVILCYLLQHGKRCMNAFSCVFVELEKFKGDFILISLCFLIFSFLLIFFEEKKIGKKLIQFSYLLDFWHHFFLFFCLILRSFQTIVPNFLEIFMVFDFLVHNSWKILNLNFVLVP